MAQRIPGPSAKLANSVPAGGLATLAGFQPLDSDGSLLPRHPLRQPTSPDGDNRQHHHDRQHGRRMYRLRLRDRDPRRPTERAVRVDSRRIRRRTVRRPWRRPAPHRGHLHRRLQPQVQRRGPVGVRARAAGESERTHAQDGRTTVDPLETTGHPTVIETTRSSMQQTERHVHRLQPDAPNTAGPSSRTLNGCATTASDLSSRHHGSRRPTRSPDQLAS